MKSRMFKQAATVRATASIIGTVIGSEAFSIWQEEQRIERWKQENPGKAYEMKHRKVPGTTGYYEPVASVSKNKM